jgi:hypothetical protein
MVVGLALLSCLRKYPLAVYLNMREREENLPEKLQGVSRERSPASGYWWISTYCNPSRLIPLVRIHIKAQSTGRELATKRRSDDAAVHGIHHERDIPLREEAAERHRCPYFAGNRVPATGAALYFEM